METTIVNIVCKHYLHFTDDEDENEVTSYLVVCQTLDDQLVNLIDEFEDAKKFKKQAEATEKYSYVSQVYKINSASYHFLWGKNK